MVIAKSGWMQQIILKWNFPKRFMIWFQIFHIETLLLLRKVLWCCGVVLLWWWAVVYQAVTHKRFCPHVRLREGTSDSQPFFVSPIALGTHAHTHPYTHKHTHTHIHSHSRHTCTSSYIYSQSLTHWPRLIYKRTHTHKLGLFECFVT